MEITEKFKESAQKMLKDGKVYFKALSISQLEDINPIMMEVSSGNIVVAKITPLAQRSIEDIKKAVDELCSFVENIGGEIARLGDERIVIVPSTIKIWREKGNI